MALTESSIREVVENQHAQQPFSGVVLVRQGGDIVYQGTFGYACRAHRIANTIDTRFGIASGTKTLTGVAVCQLVEQGKLDFDTRLTDCVAYSFPNFDPGITIHHLLTHTSGAPDYFDEEELDAQADFGALWDTLPVYKVREPKDLLPLFQNQPMKFPPGQRASYNNGGFILLGLVIEAASGMPYADYVQKNVLERAGMADSGFFETDRLPERAAFGYLDDGRTNIFQIPVKGLSDGGLFVTAPDFARFWDALLGHRLLSAEITARMLQPHVLVNAEKDDHRFYGYGIQICQEGDAVRWYYAEGADPGVAFNSEVLPAQNADLTVIGNTESEAWPVFDVIEKLIVGD